MGSLGPAVALGPMVAGTSGCGDHFASLWVAFNPLHQPLGAHSPLALRQKARLTNRKDRVD